MEYEYSLAAYPLVFHQHIFSELAKNLSCNCQFNVKISPLHILKGSSCLSCLSVLFMFPIPYQPKFTHYGKKWYVFFTGPHSIYFLTGVHTEGLLMLLSIYKAECKAELWKRQLFRYSRVLSDICLAKTEMSPDLTNNSSNIRVFVPKCISKVLANRALKQRNKKNNLYLYW